MGFRRHVATLPRVLVASCVVLASPAYALAQNGDTNTPLLVETRRVETANGYTVRERFAGRVVSKRVSQLGFERGGTLDGVLVEEGDRVAAGQVLARLDTRQLHARRRELGAQLAQSRAKIGEVEARLKLSRLTRERQAKLFDRGVASAQQLDESVYEERALAAQLESATASVATVEAAIDGVEVSLALSQLEAPYEGGITARLVDEGTVVAAGQPIVQLLELSRMEVRIGIPPDTAADLLPGERYPVEIAGRGQDLALVTILKTIDPATRTRTAIFAHEEPAEEAQNNALAHLVVERRLQAPGFWLPITALTEGRRGLWSAFVAVPAENDGGGGGEQNRLMRVERRQLQVIHADADRAYVRGTIHDGELVITTGIHRLVPDQLVRLAP